MSLIDWFLCAVIVADNSCPSRQSEVVGRGKGLVSDILLHQKSKKKRSKSDLCQKIHLCGHLDSKMRGILLKPTKIERALQKFSKEFGSTTLQIPGVNEGLGLDSLSKNITSLVLTRLVR